MSAGHSGKSHVTTWILAIIAMPVMYVLTTPPLYCCLVNCHHAADPWITRYMVPFGWVEKDTPLRKPLAAYFNWCHEHLVE